MRRAYFVSLCFLEDNLNVVLIYLLFKGNSFPSYIYFFIVYKRCKGLLSIICILLYIITTVTIVKFQDLGYVGY